MKEINVKKIEDTLASMCGEIAVVYNSAIRKALAVAKEKEDTQKAMAAMVLIMPLPKIATTTMASSNPGKASSRSMKREIRESIQPP